MTTQIPNRQSSLLEQIGALQKTDISPIIRMAGLVLPKAFKALLPELSEAQRNALCSVFPEGGNRSIYFQIVKTPTPPIVLRLSQPLVLTTATEEVIRGQGIQGIRLTIGDLQLAAKGLSAGNMMRLAWAMKGQVSSLLSIMKLFRPVLKLKRSERKDMIMRAKKHFKPVLDLLA